MDGSLVQQWTEFGSLLLTVSRCCSCRYITWRDEAVPPTLPGSVAAGCMLVVSECLSACLLYVYELFPKLTELLHLPAAPSCCTMAEGPRTGEEDPEEEEAEEFRSSSHCSELCRRQNEQRKSRLFCDVWLDFNPEEEEDKEEEDEEHTVCAHRSVLSAASPYFSLLLGGQFTEARSRRVQLREWSSGAAPEPDTVEAVVQFMYTGEITVTTANVHEVLELADRY